MAPLTVPWGNGFSVGCGVSRLSGTPKGCPFELESLQAAKSVSVNEEMGRPRQAEFNLEIIADAEGYSRAVRLSGSGGVRVKAVASASARLSLLNDAASSRASLSLYGRKMLDLRSCYGTQA